MANVLRVCVASCLRDCSVSVGHASNTKELTTVH